MSLEILQKKKKKHSNAHGLSGGLNGCGSMYRHRNCVWVGNWTAHTAANGISAHVLHAELHMCHSENGSWLPPLPNLTVIDPWMKCRMNEFCLCRGELMILIMPQISILFRNPIIAANWTRKVSLFSEWCYLFICQSALHFLRSQTSPCLAMLIL